MQHNDYPVIQLLEDNPGLCKIEHFQSAMRGILQTGDENPPQSRLLERAVPDVRRLVAAGNRATTEGARD